MAELIDGIELKSDLPADVELICKDCKQPFVFTGKDQAFYKRMGFETPKRDKACRNKRNAAREARNQT